MTTFKTAESIINKADEMFDIYGVTVYTLHGNRPSKGSFFDTKEEAIAAYGDEEVCKWKIESAFGDKVSVTVKLKKVY